MECDVSQYFQVILKVPSAQADELAQEIGLLPGFLGIHEDDPPTPMDTVIFKAYFGLSAQEWKPFLERLMQDFQLDYEIQGPLAGEDWLSNWKTHFQPVELAGPYRVVPQWWDPRDIRPTDIRLNPGMAFGTGHHDTTRLCAYLMWELHARGETPRGFLDVGCGSGILTLLAGKMGWSPLMGLDIDPVAIENAQEQAQLNEMSQVNWVLGRISDLPKNQRFDVVCANILSSTLKELSLQLTEKTQKYLILSGFLVEDEMELLTQFLSLGWSLERRFETPQSWIGWRLKK